MEQKELVLETEGFADVVDLTEPIASFLGRRETRDGLLNVFVPGSTAGVTTLEYEPGCVEDLVESLDAHAPRDKTYHHDARHGDGNGFSHLRAAWLGPSLTVPVREGEVQTGTWQQVVLVDCDNRPRSRTILLTLR